MGVFVRVLRQKTQTLLVLPVWGKDVILGELTRLCVDGVRKPLALGRGIP